MVLRNGYTALAPGKIAAIAMTLDMTARPPPLVDAPAPGWVLQAQPAPDLGWYRDLYRRIGQHYLWQTRLRASDAELARITHHPDLVLHALIVDGAAEGMLELDFRKPGACELTFFGVTPPFYGSGAARWMMNRAMELVWSRPVSRFWLYTCTLDHPGAVRFYERTGFRARRRFLEIADDPRLDGTLPPDAAPHVPIL